MVKKTILKEFDGSYLIQQAHKLKGDGDELIGVDVSNANIGHVALITKKGMAIRFPVTNVNSMGKVASGVTGISLKDEDEVTYGKCFINVSQDNNGEVAITSLNEYKFQLISKNKEIEEIYLSEIKLQNRAGRGSSIMLVLHEDEIKNVNLV